MDHDQRIYIDVGRQELVLFDGGLRVMSAPVSTSRYGLGELMGSEKTPRGPHVIRAKIGFDAPLNQVFVGRRPTHETYCPELGKSFPDRDWILTRILWLSGLVVGFNRLGNVDTMRRYIYIHGCPDELELGSPQSHGCIRIHNLDITRLFDSVSVGTRVFIDENPKLPGS